MIATCKTFLEQTAGDLMSRDVIVLHQDTPVREAARILLQGFITGAPVVDEQGRCVGVLSATDFLRLAWPGKDTVEPSGSVGTCQFLRKTAHADGSVKSWCTLPPGACLLQQPGDPAEEQPLCSLPTTVLADWQMIDIKELPTTSIHSLMTANPVTVSPETPIRSLARMMIDAHIHRIIVVDESEHPVGIVSSTDILAAIARAED